MRPQHFHINHGHDSNVCHTLLSSHSITDDFRGRVLFLFAGAMMHDSYIVKRTQIYLEDSQAAELARKAKSRGTTASKMIREAVDAYLAGEPDDAEWLTRQRTALDESFGSIPRLPDGATYVREMRARDAARLEELERR